MYHQIDGNKEHIYTSKKNMTHNCSMQSFFTVVRVKKMWLMHVK